MYRDRSSRIILLSFFFVLFFLFSRFILFFDLGICKSKIVKPLLEFLFIFSQNKEYQHILSESQSLI